MDRDTASHHVFPAKVSRGEGGQRPMPEGFKETLDRLCLEAARHVAGGAMPPGRVARRNGRAGTCAPAGAVVVPFPAGPRPPGRGRKDGGAQVIRFTRRGQ